MVSSAQGPSAQGPSAQGQPALPLAGIVVVALEQAVAVPFATRQLADLGARVIKVERPGTGDFARGYDRSVLGQASYFVWLNRGKESVELDVKTAGGQAALAALLDRADVFVQNLAPGAAERLGLGAAELRARHPRLICCSVSGYGPDGPYHHKKAYDLLVQCEAGLLSVTGTPDEPCKAGISVADIAAGMYAYSGILTALYERERTGRGSSVEVAMLEALGEWMSQPYYYNVYGGQDARRTGARHASISPYGPYLDGQVFLGLQNDREWAVLCERVLGRPDLITDERFSTHEQLAANAGDARAILKEAFESAPLSEWRERLEAFEGQWAVAQDSLELTKDVQVEANGHLGETTTADGTPFTLVTTPVQFAGTPSAPKRAPEFNEHRDEVLASAGYSTDSILELAVEGVVA